MKTRILSSHKHQSQITFLAGLVISFFIMDSVGHISSTAQTTAPENKTSPAQPDEKRSFSDDDIREKPGGFWAAGPLPDKKQFDDPSSLVVVKRVNSLIGRGKYAGLMKLTEVGFVNRSPKDVQSLRLRWFIVDAREPEKILLEGVTPTFDAGLPAQSERTLDIPIMKVTQIVKPLVRNGELTGDLIINLGVQEVTFTDGSVWQRTEPSVFYNMILPFSFMKASFQKSARLPPLQFIPCKRETKFTLFPLSFAQVEEDPDCLDNARCRPEGGACTPAFGNFCDLSACNEISCNCGTSLGRCPCIPPKEINPVTGRCECPPDRPVLADIMTLIDANAVPSQDVCPLLPFSLMS